MTFPTGILKNKATGRFHPISFRRAPMPGRMDEDAAAQRYRSSGHHIEGFESLEEAVQFVKNEKNMELIDTVWEWDGEGNPAMTKWFSPQSKEPT